MLWAGIALGVLGAAGSIIGGNKAADAAKDAAARDAYYEDLVTREKIRNLRREEDELRGDTIAITAASGVNVNMGSPLDVLAEQATEYRNLRNITEKVGATRAANAIARGNAAAKTYKWNAYSSAIQQLGGIPWG